MRLVSRDERTKVVECRGATHQKVQPNRTDSIRRSHREGSGRGLTSDRSKCPEGHQRPSDLFQQSIRRCARTGDDDESIVKDATIGGRTAVCCGSSATRLDWRKQRWPTLKVYAVGWWCDDRRGEDTEDQGERRVRTNPKWIVVIENELNAFNRANDDTHQQFGISCDSCDVRPKCDRRTRMVC
jgi:hypothetical protein